MNRARRDVHLAAHATADADQPPPEVPPTNSLPAPTHSTSPMKRSTEGPISSGEFVGPMRQCDTPGYWIPENEFPMMGKWVGGAELLLARPHLTRDTAFETTPNGGGGAETRSRDDRCEGERQEEEARVFRGYGQPDTQPY